MQTARLKLGRQDFSLRSNTLFQKLGSTMLINTGETGSFENPQQGTVVLELW